MLHRPNRKLEILLMKKLVNDKFADSPKLKTLITNSQKSKSDGKSGLRKMGQNGRGLIWGIRVFEDQFRGMGIFEAYFS